MLISNAKFEKFWIFIFNLHVGSYHSNWAVCVPRSDDVHKLIHGVYVPAAQIVCCFPCPWLRSSGGHTGVDRPRFYFFKSENRKLTISCLMVV